MKTKQVSKSNVAAYNHGYCYAVTYSARNAIGIKELCDIAEGFYDKNSQRGWFTSGYERAITQIGEGKISTSSLLTTADLT